MIYYSALFLDFLSVTEGRVAKLLYHHYIFQNRYPAYRYLVTTEKVNFISNGCFESVTYWPSSKTRAYHSQTTWPQHGVQEGKPAKTIRKLFTPRALKILKDRDFEFFDNAYKAWFKTNMNFELLPNTEIKRVYNMTIANGEGSLNGSCMNGHGQCMDIYNECQLLRILTLNRTDGVLLGRALVWQLGEITLMDRIYVVEDYMYQCFIAYAVRNKWWYKMNYKSYNDKQTFIDSDGNTINKNFKVHTSTNFQSFPYIDTFTYGDGDSLNNYGDGPYEYNCAEGTRCGIIMDAIQGINIRARNAVQIECGEKSGKITHRDNTVIVQGQYWWNRDSALCIIDGTYYQKKDTYFINGEWQLEPLLETTPFLLRL
jgi:hypothetical protein